MRNVILYTLTPRFPGQLPRAISPALIRCETLRFNRALEVTNGGSCLREIHFQQKGWTIYLQRRKCRTSVGEIRIYGKKKEREIEIDGGGGTDEVSPSSSAGKSVGINAERKGCLLRNREDANGLPRTLVIFHRA